MDWRLRPLRVEDAAALHEAMRDPEVMRYWSTPPHESLEETSEFLRRGLESGAREFVIECEGEIAGRVALYGDDELGFFLLRRFWGLGLMTLALEELARHAFEEWGCGRLFADVDPRNEASLAVLERLGFRRTGAAPRTWLVGGEWCDSVYLELRRPQGR
jgi:[ribosomal protein S5]-alanine N-acetyltransferase